MSSKGGKGMFAVSPENAGGNPDYIPFTHTPINVEFQNFRSQRYSVNCFNCLARDMLPPSG
jgi:hypothetical protein